MAIETLIIQGEDVNVLDGASLKRTQTSNPEAAPGTSVFDEFGLRPNYTGEGHLDINGTGAGDKLSFSFDAPVGTYAVTIRLASGATGSGDGFDRSILLKAEGVGTPAQNTNSDGWGIWQEKVFTITVNEAGSHTVVLARSGANGPNIDAIAVHEVGAAVNFAAPGFTGGTAFDVVENTTAVGAVTATDLDGDDLTFAIAAGDDAALFEMGADTGTLRFLAAPDFETPGSDAVSNTYTLTVVASDGVDTTEQAVTVTDDPELPQPVIVQRLAQGEAATIPAGAATIVRDQEGAAA